MTMKMTTRNKTVVRICRASAVAAAYVALTLPFASISFGPLQLRLSEALTVLPFLFPETIPGLFAGCILSNLFSPNILPLDISLGSLATLIAAVLTSKIKNKYLAPLPPVLVNALFVGFIITYSERGFAFSPSLFAANCGMIFISQFLSCYLLGLALLISIEKNNKRKNSL